MSPPAASPPLGTPEPRNFRRLDELSLSQLRALDRHHMLAVCAVSALEVHGPHLPIGADFHQAVWMADETGRRFAATHPEWTVLRHPPLPIGADELPISGSINTPSRSAPVSYSGWPAVASPEIGRAYAELSVRASLTDLLAVVEGRSAAVEIRSIASDPAILQPNFWRWAAAAAGAGALALHALA